MDTAIIVIIVLAVMLGVYVHMSGMFIGKLIRQNTELMKSADKRLDKANEMVLKMAHSADMLATTVSELKDMMVHLETVYTSRTDMVIKNRDEFKESYTKLLHRYEELGHKYENMMKESYNTVKELARRPTMTNNNTNNMQDDVK